MTRLVLVLATLAAQRALGAPGMPGLAGELLLPLVWIVGPPLREHTSGHWFFAMILGLGWDLVLEPVVGPGGIVWSAAALGVAAVAGVVADRSPKAWLALGSLAALMVLALRHAVLWTLGLTSPVPSAPQVLRCVLLGGLWCFLVGWVLALDLPTRWRHWRARRLR
jgi:hypothetical protein